MARAVNLRSTRTIGALAALCVFGAQSGYAQSQRVLEQSHRRHLQTGTAGTPVYVEKTDGEDILSSQYDGSALLVSIIVVTRSEILWKVIATTNITEGYSIGHID